VGMTRNHKMTRNFLEMTRIDGKGKGKLQEPETERGDIENLLLHVAIEYLVVQNYVMRRMRLSAVTISVTNVTVMTSNLKLEFI
jgi:hypothetical protein